MAEFKQSAITKQGLALLAKAQAGDGKITFSKFEIGNGIWADNTSKDVLSAQTELRNWKMSFGITDAAAANDATTELTLVMSNANNKEGFNITELGIYAMDGTKEILYFMAVTNEDTSDWFPAYNSVTPNSYTYRVYLSVANSSTVSIAGKTGAVRQDDFEALVTRVGILEKGTVKKYGARKKVIQSACGAESWERLGAAIGLAAKAAVGTGAVQNDFMTSVYPYNACRPCNISLDGKIRAYLGDANFAWDGSNGDVMLEMPICYTSRYFETDEDGVEWEYRWVSSAPEDGMHINPAFIDGDTIFQKIYIPCFLGSASKNGDTDTISSVAGSIPLVEKTRANFRTLSRAKGDGWQLDDIWNMFLLDHLFIIMFAGTQEQAILSKGKSEFVESSDDKALVAGTSVNKITIETSRAAHYFVGQQISIGTTLWNHNIAFGRTITKAETSTDAENATDIYFDGDAVDIAVGNVIWSSGQKTGETIAMASPNGQLENPTGITGNVLAGRRSCRFLWIEDWYGNLWQFRDGVNIKSRQHYCCQKRASYADNTYDGDFEKIGYVCSTNEGYIKKMGYDSTHPEYEMPIEVGGGADSYFGDYYYSSDGGTLVFSGANVCNGTISGSFCRACGNSAGSSYWDFGGRPSYKNH